MQNQSNVTPEATSQPDLRKLARALIALARRQAPHRNPGSGDSETGAEA